MTNLELLQALREHANPTMDAFWQAVTILGEHLVLAGICFLIYWCLDKKTGRYLILSLGLSLCVNALLKDLVQAPRPFWQPGAPEALRLETATGYSFPSGHSQAAATLYTALALRISKRWVKAVLAALILGVGFSRLYLGVHYLEDVIAGVLLGAGISLLMNRLVPQKGFKVTTVLCALIAVLALVLAKSRGTCEAVGLLAGILSGFWLEDRAVGFDYPAGLRQSLLRLTAGGLLIGICYRWIPLRGEDPFTATLVRNAVVGFMATGGYPWLFRKWERG